MIALVPIEDLHALESAEDELDVKEAKEALQDIKFHGAIPWEDIKKQRNLKRNK